VPVSALSAVIRRVGADPGEPDAALLERFTSTGDQAAFAELVRRYSRLVWALCRHSLPCDADADDAFQATFLTLARHAGSVRDPHRLGPWLHTVSVRVCKNARRAGARRTKREAGAAVPERSRPVADSAWDAAAAAVHEEVAKLPAAHRVAFVLCVLEGKTPTAAAAQLGIPVGTVGAHLHRAKERLLKRLAARGLGAAVAFATLLATPPASAVERALAVALTPPAAVLPLLNGAVPMAIPHAKLLLVLAVLTAGLVGLLLPTAAQDPPKATPPKAEKPADPKAKFDLHGDPLPDKAVMRLGTVKYRFDGIVGSGFKKSGELMVLNNRQELHTFPADGGPKATVTRLQEDSKEAGTGMSDFSQDGRFAVSAMWDEAVKKQRLTVWDFSGAKPVEHLRREFKFGPGRVALSPDGRWMAMHNQDRQDPENVLVADLTTKKWKILPVNGIEYVERFTFTQDGKRLALSASSGAVMVFDTDTTELLLNAKISGERIEAIALSPDGKTVAMLPGTWLYGEEQQVRLLNVADGAEVKELTLPKAKARSLGFGADGKTLWVLGDTRLREWDLAAGKWLREATVPQDYGVAPRPVWSPDGKRFVVHNLHTVSWFDAKTWKPLHPEPLAAGPNTGITGITVSADGKTIATEGYEIHLWDSSTSKLLGKVKSTLGNQPMMVFLPDSKSFIAVAEWQHLIECDARTGKELRRFKLPDDLKQKVMLSDLRLSADGKTLYSEGRSASSAWKSARLRWDVAKGEVSGRAESDERERFGAEFPGGTSPDGEWRVQGGEVSRTDRAEKPTQVFSQEEALFGNSSWSADSKRVAMPRSAGKTPEERWKGTNATTVVFDVTTKEKVIELPTGRARRSAFTPDGRHLATVGPTGVVVWDLSTGKEVFRAGSDSPNASNPRAITFTPDGKRLITGHGTHAFVWDVSTATAK